MLGNIPLEKKKHTAQQEVTGARWQEVVRSSQFKSADGTATPNQLQSQTRSYYSSRWRKSHSSALPYKQKLPE